MCEIKVDDEPLGLNNIGAISSVQEIFVMEMKVYIYRQDPSSGKLFNELNWGSWEFSSAVWVTNLWFCRGEDSVRVCRLLRRRFIKFLGRVDIKHFKGNYQSLRNATALYIIAIICKLVPL